MEEDIWRKGKVKKATEFVKRTWNIYEEAGITLRKAEEEIK